MPFSIRFAQLFADSHHQLENGQHEAARQSMLVAEELYKVEKMTLLDHERMMVSAAMGMELQALGLQEKALGYVKEACQLALLLEPDSSMTFGDLWKLMEIYEELGRYQEALDEAIGMQELCRRVSPQYWQPLQGRIKTLMQKIEQTGSGVKVSIACRAISYGLIHCGIKPIKHFIITNTRSAPMEINWQITLDGYSGTSSQIQCLVPANDSVDVQSQIDLHLDHTKLQAQTERAKAFFRITGTPSVSPNTIETWVLPLNEYSLEAANAASLAAFVHPNNAAIKLINGSLIPEMESSVSAKINSYIESEYTYLQKYDLLYDFEPPSWECNSQRVRFPDEILVGRRGTCLDFSLLFAGLIENGLYNLDVQPIIIRLKGNLQHALFGCWLQDPLSDEVVLTNKDDLIEWIEKEMILVVETTGIAQHGPFWKEKTAYSAACKKARDLLRGASEVLAINIGAARVDILTGRSRITPLPFRNEPPYGESALRVFHLAHEAWVACPTNQLQSTHLLASLLVYNGLSRKLFATMAQETDNPKLNPDILHKFILDGLRQKISNSPEQSLTETEGYTTAVIQAKQVTCRYGELLVEDFHLLLAILTTPGASITKVLNFCDSSPKECLSYMEMLNPSPRKKNISEFPSEVL